MNIHLGMHSLIIDGQAWLLCDEDAVRVLAIVHRLDGRERKPGDGPILNRLGWGLDGPTKCPECGGPL